MIDDLGLLLARLAVGGSIAAHGAQKAYGWFDGPGPNGAAAFFEQIGLKPGATLAQAAAINELGAGVLIALGAGGPAGPAMLLSTMLVAQTTVHAKNGFFAAKNGVELGVLYAAAALALASAGYGRFSVDRATGLERPLRHPAVTTLALAAALAGGAAILANRRAG